MPILLGFYSVEMQSKQKPKTKKDDVKEQAELEVILEAAELSRVEELFGIEHRLEVDREATHRRTGSANLVEPSSYRNMR